MRDRSFGRRCTSKTRMQTGLLVRFKAAELSMARGILLDTSTGSDPFGMSVTHNELMPCIPSGPSHAHRAQQAEERSRTTRYDTMK